MPKEVSLKEFIDDNYKMLAVMGVLGAIIAFFEESEGTEFLITWSFIGFLLVNWELWKILGEIPVVSRTLMPFGASLLGVFLYISGYVIVNYWQQLFLVGVPILIAIPIINLLVRFRVEERIKPSEVRMYKWLAYILVFMFYIIIYVTLDKIGVL